MEHSIGHQTEGGPGDWVKELFAPIYTFDDVVAAGKHGLEVKDNIIKRVPILDPLAVKDVFERVHQRVVEAELAKQQEQEEKEECLEKPPLRRERLKISANMYEKRINEKEEQQQKSRKKFSNGRDRKAYERVLAKKKESEKQGQSKSKGHFLEHVHFHHHHQQCP